MDQEGSINKKQIVFENDPVIRFGCLICLKRHDLSMNGRSLLQAGFSCIKRSTVFIPKPPSSVGYGAPKDLMVSCSQHQRRWFYIVCQALVRKLNISPTTTGAKKLIENIKNVMSLFIKNLFKFSLLG